MPPMFVCILAIICIAALNFSEKLRVRGLNKFAFIWAIPAYLMIINICYNLYRFYPQNNLTTTQVVLANLSILCLIPQVRKLIAYILPIDPQNRLHAAILSISISALSNLSLNTDINEGLRNVIESAKNKNDVAFIIDNWTMALFMVTISFLGVGIFVRRNWHESCRRLGLIKPKIDQVWRGALFAVGFLALWTAIGYILETIGYKDDPETTRLSKEYMALYNKNIWSILTVGFAAGIGEEIMFRGALLPRLGIVYSSMLFAAMHTQYGISFALLNVFMLGLICALVRYKYNTNTAIMMHATSNILVAALHLLEPLLE